MITRRQVIKAGPALASIGIAGYAKANSTFPSRVIKIVVVNAAGGTDDAISRFIGDRVSKELGQPVIVENRGGASGTIGAAYAASSAPDGYTILCLLNAGIIQTILRSNLSYGMNSFTPLVGVGSFPLALAVSPTAKPSISNLQELAAAARSADGVTFASGGIGTMGHLTCARLLNALGGKGLHITYKNNPEGLQALMGGFTQMMFSSASEVSTLRDKVRVLGVAAPERVPNLPDVPTFKELGMPNFDVSIWHGYVAPAGIRPEVAQKLSSAISHAARDPEFLARFKPLSYQDDVITGDALKDRIRRETEQWKSVIETNNVKIQ